MQLVSSYILERTRARKKILIVCGIIQRMNWIPLGLVPLLIPMSQHALQIWMVLLFLLISAFLSPFLDIPFFSVMSDLVPPDIRGRYLAVRSRISTIAGIAGGFFTAWFLDNFTGFYSFAVVFAIAAVMGTLEIILYIGIKDPPMPPREDKEKITRMISEVLKNKEYSRFILFMTFWMFSVNLSAPFYLKHLRTGVELSYTLITLFMQILPSICSVLIITRWGMVVDTRGGKTTMWITGGLLSIVPFIWIFTANNQITVVLIAIIALMQGLLQSGFDIGVNNLMLGGAPKEKRSMYIAVYFMTTAMIGIGIANALGGWLLDNVFSHMEARNIIFGIAMTRYHFLFALSAILRSIMVFLMLPRILPDFRG